MATSSRSNSRGTTAKTTISRALRSTCQSIASLWPIRRKLPPRATDVGFWKRVRCRLGVGTCPHSFGPSWYVVGRSWTGSPRWEHVSSCSTAKRLFGPCWASRASKRTEVTFSELDLEETFLEPDSESYLP